MKNKTYLIEYIVYDKDNCIVKEGTMKVKNKASSLEAQIKFEEFLKKKYDNFDRLVVKSCKEDTMSIFGDLFGNGSSNPFGKDFKF